MVMSIARAALWLVLLVLSLYGGLQAAFHNDASCESLSQSGFWQRGSSYSVWQPTTCTMGHYEAHHIDKCFQNKTFTFHGDSIVRQVFEGVASRIKPSFAPPVDKHRAQNIKSDTSDLTVSFQWDPFLNSSEVNSMMDDWRKGASTQGAILIGAGLHYAGFSQDPLEQFKETFNRLFELNSSAHLLPQSQRVYWNPVLPTEQHLIKSNPKKVLKLTHQREDPLNDFVRHNLQDGPSLTTMWAYNEQIADASLYKKDGIHLLDDKNAIKADMLLNHYCNHKLAAMESAPPGATCCLRSEKAHTMQLISLCILIGAILAVIVRQNRRSPQTVEMSAAFILMGACLLAFICDRTDALGRIEKFHRPAEFLFFGSLAIGLPLLLSHRKIVAEKDNEPLNGSVDSFDTSPLNQDQTDEWKGWMQAVILIYHWTGTSKVQWIYRTIRLLVAAYLFMTGYGNTLSHLRKQDYSFKRVVQQLLRLNILSVLLAYTMDTSYLDYYFAPLVSLWVIVLHLTLMPFSHLNSEPKIFALKLIVSALVMSYLVHGYGIMESAFTAVNYIFNSDWTVKQARFRIALDLYVVYFGALLAFIAHYYSNSTALKERIECMSRTSQLQSQWALGITCTLVFSLWALLAIPLATNDEYNAWHPYVSPFVVIAFAILRNITQRLRTTHNSVMARLGQCSLETFTLQFHLFLANNTHATLTLGLEKYFGQSDWARIAYLAIFGLILCFLSEEVSRATKVLVRALSSSVTQRTNEASTQAGLYHFLSTEDEVESEKATDQEMIQVTVIGMTSSSSSAASGLQDGNEQLESSSPTLSTRPIYPLCIAFCLFLTSLNYLYNM